MFIHQTVRRNRSEFKIKNKIYTLKKPTIVVLHHPALEIGGWQDLKILKNRDKFREIIESSEYVRIVLAGHIHEFTDRTLNGIRYSTAPGLGFAFSSKLSNYEIQHGAEGFNLITINKNKILINKIALK
jgi:Icc protein